MKIAVLIPCRNEESTVGQVVEDFRRALPEADIYVFDNASTDATAEAAREAGAMVRYEHRPGKGNVVRRMFREVDADVYVMVDGDLTYPAGSVHDLVRPVLDGRAEMAVGDRISTKAYGRQNKRAFHSFGNRLVRWLINRLFRSDLKDIMSGYRAMTRLFVKTMPVLSEGFEIETEMTLHALDKRFNIAEVPVDYKQRPAGSHSKLKTFSDGLLVLRTIGMIFKDYKPMSFFGRTALVFFLLGLVVGVFPVYEYLAYGYVFKVPSAVLAAALEIWAMLLFCCGLILETIVRQHKENYEITLNSFRSKDRF